ncbi:MAG: ferrous iron transport protein B [Bacteroidaceae bacterium]|nr:ferrous iron transport protein B [Bacteroidaceae bacterium]
MKLSELKNGETGYIVKVLGHGGFRKRIVEMGFIRGKKVQVMQNAPLQDPVKYKIMGYEVSLRKAEAAMIEVVADRKSIIDVSAGAKVTTVEDNDDCLTHPELNSQLRHEAMRQGRTINVALIGNPNCGKTSLFNYVSGAHERVGNYSGVTVDAKEGIFHYKGFQFNIVDLPGTYSLSAYSPEELYVRKQIVEKMPDVIINAIDSTNLERNLYLTTQLIDMNLRVVGALNMYDEFEKRGDTLDIEVLSELLGIPMVPTSFKSGMGVEQLFGLIIRVYEGIAYNKTHSHNNDDKHHLHTHKLALRHIHLNYGEFIERAIKDIQTELQKNYNLRLQFSTRYLAIKLLENDRDVESVIQQFPNAKDILAIRDKASVHVENDLQEDAETAIMNARYGIIHGALKEAGSKEGTQRDTYKTTHLIDAFLTHRYIGMPLFMFIIFVMFYTTFFLGQYPMEGIEMGVEWLSEKLSATLPQGIFRDMVVDGAVAGIGAVIVFFPQILILYTFISFMEDCGYMARAAFIMDKVMHKMGLHGKSFIPLIMGFGCNVPAVMATRTIESRRSRLLTMMVIPFMSCSARLPVYIMIAGTFFAVKYQAVMLAALYAIGMLTAVVVCRLFSKFLVKGEDVPFVMELPPYRFPTLKATLRHTWEKGRQYLKKMGGIILIGSIAVWALTYFPHTPGLTSEQQQEQSYLGKIGKIIEPVFRPQGFDWKLDVSLIAGISAKEINASTLGVLYADNSDITDSNAKSETLSILHEKMAGSGIDALTAFCYLVFVLLYFPCIATISAIKAETGSWKWAAFAAAYTTLLAWIVSALIKLISSLLI